MYVYIYIYIYKYTDLVIYLCIYLFIYVFIYFMIFLLVFLRGSDYRYNIRQPKPLFQLFIEALLLTFQAAVGPEKSKDQL